MKISTIASASSPRQGSNVYNPREELLALGRDLDALQVAINVVRGRLDALGISLDAVEQAHRNIGHSFGALVAVAFPIQ
jgi:hypothetical protein